MHLPRIARTVTFRLALTQAALFAVSAAILFGAVFWSTVTFATSQLRDQVMAEMAVLAETRSTDGLAELVRMIEARTLDRGTEGHAYRLQASDGARLAGSLRSAGSEPGWQTVRQGRHAVASDDEARTIMVLGQALPTGEFLLVGRDTRHVEGIKERIAETFAWASATTLVLAMLSGIATSIGFVRRVEVVNATTRRIMAGDLGERIPVQGTGDEFDRLAANLNEMLARIQSLMLGLRQVSDDIAHDLRTPLTHVRQRLELARDGPGSREAYEAVIDATIEDTDEILSIFAALLRIAQIEAGTRKAGFGDVDLSRIFATIVETYGPVAEDNGQSLVGTIAPGVRLLGDSELLVQLLANLVENAIRYGGRGGRIGVTLGIGPAGPQASVTDQGPGIEPDLRERVFRRFFRVERHRATEGSGLGLSLVRAVADLHGMTVRLGDNRPGLIVDLSFGTAAGSQDT